MEACCKSPMLKGLDNSFDPDKTFFNILAEGGGRGSKLDSYKAYVSTCACCVT